MNGMEMMIKRMLESSGFDLGKLVGDFTNLKTFVETTLGNLDRRLTNIDNMQGEIWKKMSNDPIPVAQPIAPPVQPLQPPTQNEQPQTQQAQPTQPQAQPNLPPNLFIQPPKS